MSGGVTFLLAAALTAFLLVVAGSVVNSVADKAAAVAAAASTNPSPLSVPGAGSDGEVLSVMRQREATYRQLVEEANARLQAANEQVRRLSSTVDGGSMASTASDPQAHAPNGLISSETAVAVASGYLGGDQAVKADLEREHGRWVYEVKFTDGGVVHVSADSGEVVEATRGPEPISRGDDDHHDDEHEGAWDDDD